MRQPGQPPPTLSNRQKKFLDNNLAALGYPSYRSYLNGPEWEDAKNRYRASGKLQSCTVCRVSNVDLHHKTYKRLGQERLDDLVALCREHHDRLHELGLDVWRGSRVLYERERTSRWHPRRASRASSSLSV